jgi:tetraacyldisaccharide 4'-kinase
VKAPEFWGRDSLITKLLHPISLVFQAGTAIRRRAATPIEVGVPVICVGNLVAGGAGKTPVALSVAGHLKRFGVTLAFLTRGHGGRLMGPVKVEPDIHVARDVGDEALLLAETAATWISRDRAKGAMAARADGAELVIMDDGFQNPGLEKSLSLVVIDGAVGFGNGRVIPAGPLRETMDKGLARANAMVMIGEDRTGLTSSLPPALPLLRARIVPRPNARLPRGTRVLGFAGIGRPGKFRESLEELELEVVAFESFPDHHVYSGGEIDALLGRAKTANAIPVTTAKDHVRLPKATQARIERLDIALAWQDEAALSALLDKEINHGSG